MFSSFNVSFTGHFIEKNTDVVNMSMRTGLKEMSSHVYFYNGIRKIHFSVNTVYNHIGLCLCNPDSICVFLTLPVLASDSICGKWTQRREGVNKKGNNHVNDLKFSIVSLFTGLLKLYSSSLCWYLARSLFQFIITRWKADLLRVKCSSVSTFTVSLTLF